MPIKRPCAICSTVIRADSLKDRYCGPACAELARRREHYASAGARPGDREYMPTTDTQRSLHRARLRKRGLL